MRNNPIREIVTLQLGKLKHGNHKKVKTWQSAEREAERTKSSDTKSWCMAGAVRRQRAKQSIDAYMY